SRKRGTQRVLKLPLDDRVRIASRQPRTTSRVFDGIGGRGPQSCTCHSQVNIGGWSRRCATSGTDGPVVRACNCHGVSRPEKEATMDGSSRRNFGLYVQRSPRFRAFAVSWMIVLALIIIAIPAVQAQTYTAQTYTVVHQFAGIDGRVVRTGLTVDAAGSLYGTTWAGGQPDRGTIFKLK